MEIVQIVGFGLIAAVLILVVKEQKPLYAFGIAAFAGISLFLLVIGKIDAVIAVLENLSERAGVPSIYMATILKIIGIAYIAEFGAQIVRDTGQESIAVKIEFAGKVLILVMAVPIISVIVDAVMNLLPTGG
ncbi:stage III sporulation protein AD [Paenibacillus sp. IB182496]|uniref:Stage III sporulation protein AD n=1 Tax=Paenibacillus sabuli TaxID=2772509 RepID=A0A927BUX2_9BACL|nr:stage III sporulation protein AD [Paenibacillus sabuli]MBD2847287.1 stage III sporulation protein AD [Paenibacillus sabuli]